MVALRLGTSERRHVERLPDVATASTALDRSQVVEVAIMQVASGRYALPADRVDIACTPTRIVQAPNANPNCLGPMQIDTPTRRSVVPVIAARRVFGIKHPPRATDGIAVVLRHAEHDRPTMAFWVDDVVAVQEVVRTDMQDTPEGIRSASQLVTAVFDQKDSIHRKLVQLIDPDRLELLGRPPPPQRRRRPRHLHRASVHRHNPAARGAASARPPDPTQGRTGGARACILSAAACGTHPGVPA